jgi:hypothetical protein
MAGTFKVDDSGQQALFRHYGGQKLERIFQASARAGANAGAEVLQAAAPIGTSQPLSAIYQREGLRHGALKASVAARRIRKRGMNRQTIGFVLGPAGRGGFARHWVTGGTRPHRIGRRQHPGSRGNPWIDRNAGRANEAARRASDIVITRYLSKIPGA